MVLRALAKSSNDRLWGFVYPSIFFALFFAFAWLVIDTRLIYHGGGIETAPDLLAVSRGYRYEILTNFVLSGPLPAALERTVFTPPHRQGLHRQEGVFCAAGPGIKTGYQVSGLRIEDVAPTALHLLGQPVPGHMDGRVATQIMEPEVLRRCPPQRHEVETEERDERGRYSDDEEAQVKQTLRGLGYI